MRLFFGVLGPGEPERRQITTAAEVRNTAAHKRDAESLAEEAMTEAGRATLSNEPARWPKGCRCGAVAADVDRRARVRRPSSAQVCCVAVWMCHRS